MVEAGGAGWLFRNIPLARWQVVLLPHQQVLLRSFDFRNVKNVLDCEDCIRNVNCLKPTC